ncbi:MAG: VWA domain-containing protein [Chloroflexi bacterium]|nr:VWA domain-containing protein [Chloroflexota bacterium]
MISIGNISNAQDGRRVSINQVIVHEDGKSATAIVSVVDAEGKPLLGVTRFETYVDGELARQISTETVIDDKVGVAVLLLIDTSGSMSGEPLAQARLAATQFVYGLGDDDIAAIVPFGSEVPVEAEFTSDPASLIARIDSLEAEGQLGTALYESYIAALDIAAAAPVPRRALVLLTDGQNSAANSVSTREMALSAASSSGLPVFAIGLGTGADLDFLQELIDAAGGSLYEAAAATDVVPIFNAIGETLRSEYELTVQLPSSERTERELLVRVELPEGTFSAEATFSTPSVPVVAGDGSGSLLVPVAGLAAVVLVVVLAAFTIRRRWRAHAGATVGAGAEGTVLLRPNQRPQQAAEVGGGRLQVLEGPNAGASVGLGAGTVDIGSDPACDLRLHESGGAVGGIHARAWLQGRRLMLHHVARRRQTYVGDKTVEWATLEPRDTIRIGPHIIAFSIPDAPSPS